MYDGKVYYKYKRDITEKIHAITQRNKELLSQNNPSTNDSNIRDGERKIIDYNMNHIQPIDTVKFQLKDIAFVCAALILGVRQIDGHARRVGRLGGNHRVALPTGVVGSAA